MILPRDIRPLLENLEPVVEGWPVNIPFDRVVDWLLQFDPEDYDVGARIVRHLNILGTDEIRSGLSIAYTRLQRKATDRNAKITSGNTIFAAIGDIGKSGAMMAYEFRVANELPEGNFSEGDREDYLKAGLVENVVLIDDVIGTGTAAVREAKRVVEETTTLGVKNVFVLAICGFEKAVLKVEEEAGAHAFAAFTYSLRDTAGILDGDFYTGLDHTSRTQYLERLKYYNQRCSRSEMGYGNVGALLAFRHNTPNVSLPVIWGAGNGWKPLFPRVGRISGIERYYSQFAAAQRAQKEHKQPTPASREALDLTVLVEGKSDETVMDTLIARYDLPRLIGVKSITTVSIGGVLHSHRLFDLLKESGRRFILILDADPFLSRRRGEIERDASVPVVFLRPGFVGLFVLERVVAAYALPSGVSLGDGEEPIEERLYLEYERVLRRAGFGRSKAMTEKMIEHFLDPDKFNGFVEELHRAVDTLVAEPPLIQE